MLPRWHILFGFTAAYLLVYFFNFSLVAGITIFLASFLIDADHYLTYIYRTKNFNTIKAYNSSINSRKKWDAIPIKERKKYKITHMPFHGIEFILVLFFLSRAHQFFLWILIGVLIHFAIDIPDLIYGKLPIYSKLSQVVVWQTNKNKKQLK